MPAKVAAARQKLAATGLYGTRITIDHVEPGAPVPYPNYFANLIVSDTLLGTGKVPGNARAVARHLKPLGGVICLGLAGRRRRSCARRASNISDWIDATGLVAKRRGGALSTRNGWSLLTRGPLPGADGWSHPYGNAGNTSSNKDDAGAAAAWACCGTATRDRSTWSTATTARWGRSRSTAGCSSRPITA